jgi:hypothetical protein
MPDTRGTPAHFLRYVPSESAKNECPRQQCSYCEEYGHEERRSTFYACGSSTHQTPRSFDCSEHKCATCQGELEPKGHCHKNCPLAQGDARKLSGHIAGVCTFRQCYDVEVDYLNLLLLTKARNTMELLRRKWPSVHTTKRAPHRWTIYGVDRWDQVKQRFAMREARPGTQ